MEAKVFLLYSKLRKTYPWNEVNKDDVSTSPALFRTVNIITLGRLGGPVPAYILFRDSARQLAGPTRFLIGKVTVVSI